VTRRLALAFSAVLLLTGCTALEQLRGLIQPPRFDEAPGHEPSIRLLGPGTDLPIGGATVRLWARVSNPNPFSLTLGLLRGSLYLDDRRAADASFPLGLPLAGGADATIPIDLSVSFSELPGLADAIRRAINRQPLAYRLEGTIGVDAGRLGQPVFGPLTFLRGNIN
jgi:hypothetical protein